MEKKEKFLKVSHFHWHSQAIMHLSKGASFVVPPPLSFVTPTLSLSLTIFLSFFFSSLFRIFSFPGQKTHHHHHSTHHTAFIFKTLPRNQLFLSSPSSLNKRRYNVWATNLDRQREIQKTPKKKKEKSNFHHKTEQFDENNRGPDRKNLKRLGIQRPPRWQ